MSSINTSYRLMLLYLVLVMLLFLSGCNEATPSILLNIPRHPVIHTFDLSARHGLRDIAGDFLLAQVAPAAPILVLQYYQVKK